MKRSSLLRFCADESGAELVEFALTGSLLMMLLLGIMDGSRAAYTDHYVASAAREATRYAMVRGSSFASVCGSVAASGCVANGESVAAYLKSVTPAGMDVSRLTVTTAWPGMNAAGAACASAAGNNSPGCLVKVRVDYPFRFMFPFLPQGALVISSTSAVTISQ